jgi:small ligand-binding sensory domain FIST
MKWVSAMSEARSSLEALDALEKSVLSDLKEEMDIAFLFVSPFFKNDFDKLPGLVSDRLGCRVLIGCSAGGVIADRREIERRPAISIVGASLPGVVIKPFHLDQSDLPGLDASPKKWQTCFGTPVGLNQFATASVEEEVPPAKLVEGALLTPQFVLLADPFTMDVEKPLQGLDYAYPNAVKIGGLASGAVGAGQNALFLNRERYRSGMIGVALSGDIVIDTIVAQGCRPIGHPFSITKCEKNMLVEINGQKPIDLLQNLYQELSESDQRLMQHSLFIGLAMTPFKETLSRGDFLIRNLMGVDSTSGAITLGALLHEGQIAQFHLRDKETSAEDLKWYMARYQMEKEPKSARGALLFTCMGRGANLYGEPDFETRLFHAQLGPVPMGGFFCNGEICAVGQTTFLHGYTSCFGIFRDGGIGLQRE